MKNFLELLGDIYHNGVELPDRTGVGRRKVFGRQLRFKLADGFPLITTNRTPINSIIKELLWFIRGDSNVNVLNSQDVHIWDQWAVRKEHVESFVNRGMPDSTQEEKEIMIDAILENSEGEIGSLYGTAWREAPRRFYNTSFPHVMPSEVAPDRLAILSAKYEENKEELLQNNVSFDSFLQAMNYTSIDQLQELIVNLKKRPFSSRHIISAWIPDFIPFEEMSPQDNVIVGLGALAPCHVLQQYIVMPAKEEGGKLRLSLQMYQR